METARICRTDQCRSVFLAMMETMETVATETGEEPGDARPQDGDLFGMSTQHALGHLHHDVQSA